MKKVLLGMGLITAMAFGAAYAGEGHMHSSPQKPAPVKQESGVCPVMHGKAKKEFAVTYKGKTYNLCCQGCISMFNKNPEKYAAGSKKTK